MLWSRIAKARILDIARIVFGISWASARSKTKKAPLAEAMETAFAAGDTPVGLSAQMHAAALAWTPPGFAAFDTGRIGDGADDPVAVEAPSPPDTAGAETIAAPETDPAETAAETGETAAGDEGDGSGGNAHAAPVDHEPGQADAAPGHTAADAAPAADIADRDGDMPPVPANGHDPAPDPMEIPEFLRRVQ